MRMSTWWWNRDHSLEQNKRDGRFTMRVRTKNRGRADAVPSNGIRPRAKKKKKNHSDANKKKSQTNVHAHDCG